MTDTSESATKKQKTDEPIAPEALAANRSAASTASDALGMYRETPILNVLPTYGLQETHTTTLPSIFWISMNDINANGARLKLQLNKPFNHILTTLNALPTSDSANWVHLTLAGETGALKTETNRLWQPLGVTTTAGIPSIKPNWWTYFSKLYQYYTVLACHYKIIIHNPRLKTSDGEYGTTVMHYKENFKTGDSTGNVMPDYEYFWMHGNEQINKMLPEGS